MPLPFDATLKDILQKFTRDFEEQLFQGVQAMRESSTYQAILDEGRQEGRQEGMLRLLQRQGRQKFGSPSDDVMATLTLITDLDRLERMADRILTVSTWDELLATP